MKREQIMVVVTGAHVLVIGGLLISQGCGTTRAPLPPQDDYVMPPSEQEETYVAPVPKDPLPPPPPPPVVAPVAVVAPADTTTYVVAIGDALSVIAKRYDVSLQDVMRINNISNPDLIRVGQRIELPGTIQLDQPERPARTTRSAPDAAPEPISGKRYVVQPGDSLSEIAQRTGTEVEALKRLNNISDVNMIRVGQELNLPGGAGQRAASPAADNAEPVAQPESTEPAAPAPEVEQTETETSLLPPARGERAAPQTYTVEIGDDLISVASEFNVSISALRDVNDLESNILVPGRTLIIPDVE